MSITNSRFVLWRLWHGDNPRLVNQDFILWSERRWDEFHAENTLSGKTNQELEDFLRWLIAWVREEISKQPSRLTQSLIDDAEGRN